MKKRLLAVLLTLALCAPCFAACDIFENDSDRDDPKRETHEETTHERLTEGESEGNSQESSADEAIEDESVSETANTSSETSSDIPSDTFVEDSSTEDEASASETEESGSEETSEEESSENAEPIEFEFVSRGDGTCYVSCCLKHDAVSVVVPDFSPDGDYVTGIGEFAFYQMESLVSVTLSEYVKRIELQAFYGCSSLESINIPDSLAYLANDAFEECDSLLETVDGVVYVGNWAVDHDNLRSGVVLRDGTRGIAEEAFYYGSITCICIPESLEIVCKNSFNEFGIFDTVYYYGDPTLWGQLRVDYAQNQALKAADVINVKSFLADDADSEGLEFVSRGDGTCYIAGIGECDEDLVLIPSISPLGDIVTAIGERAFEKSEIKGVRMPHTVVSIGAEAFSECENLKIVRVSDNLETVGDKAFYCCGNLEYISLPSSVERVGEHAFSECSEIISGVYEGIRYLGNGNDPYLVALSVIDRSRESYILHNETKFICSQLFYNCSMMESIEIPESVKSIGSSAFYRCYGLQSVSLNEGLEYLGSYAFVNCEKLEGIEIPTSITAIAPYTFNGCRALKSIYIPDTVTEIGDNAFLNCDSLESVSIPNTVERIGRDVFEGCSNLVFNEFENICYLGNDDNEYLVMYALCGELEDTVSLVEGTRVIAPYAFWYSGNTSFASLFIPRSVVYIGDSAFVGCNSIETIVVDRDNEVYASQGNCLIDKRSSTLILGCKNSVIPTGVEVIGKLAFQNVPDIKTLAIPEGVTHIEASALSNCYDLESVSLPSTLLRIEESAFSGCGSLVSLEIPESVRHVGKNAFSGCNSLVERVGDTMVVGDWLIGFYDYGAETYTVDGNIKGIAAYAFENMTFLYSLTIPEGVECISDDAFANCERLIEICNLTEMDIKAGSSDFGGVALYAKNVYGKEGERSLLREEDGFVIFDGGEELGIYVIKYAGNDIYPVIPDSVGKNGYEIYMYAFYGRSDTVAVTLKDGVTAIGKQAFFGCSSLLTVNLPDSLQTIGERAFRGCSSLVSIRIPEKVTEIKMSTFDSCSALELVTVCAPEISFKMYAFSGCSSLESMVIYSRSIGLEMSAFSGCSSLKTIYYTSDGVGMGYTSTGNSYYLDAEVVYNYSPAKGE